MKVYIVGGAMQYKNFIYDSEIVLNIKDADLVVFTGGADVNPGLYNCIPNVKSYFNIQRDEYEIIKFEEALMLGKNMVGVCRGSQLLTIMAGGKLIQHVNNHSLHYTHNISFNGERREITSTHHQMMYPFDMKASKYEIIAHSDGNRSDVYEFEPGVIKTSIQCEPEIVYYPEIKALAIQGHPEDMNTKSDTVMDINILLQNIY